MHSHIAALAAAKETSLCCSASASTPSVAKHFPLASPCGSAAHSGTVVCARERGGAGARRVVGRRRTGSKQAPEQAGGQAGGRRAQSTTWQPAGLLGASPAARPRTRGRPRPRTAWAWGCPPCSARSRPAARSRRPGGLRGCESSGSSGQSSGIGHSLKTGLSCGCRQGQGQGQGHHRLAALSRPPPPPTWRNAARLRHRHVWRVQAHGAHVAAVRRHIAAVHGARPAAGAQLSLAAAGARPAEAQLAGGHPPGHSLHQPK